MKGFCTDFPVFLSSWAIKLWSLWSATGGGFPKELLWITHNKAAILREHIKSHFSLRFSIVPCWRSDSLLIFPSHLLHFTTLLLASLWEHYLHSLGEAASFAKLLKLLILSNNGFLMILRFWEAFVDEHNNQPTYLWEKKSRWTN